MPASLSDCSAYDICSRSVLDVMRKKQETLEMKGTNIVHLMCDVLEPAMCRLDARDHLCQLGANDGLSVERLAKRLPLL